MEHKKADSNISERELRQGLGNFATGVTIVTAINNTGQQAGLTVSSFNSVSIDPALVLWSIKKTSANYPIFEQADYFAIHVLEQQQLDLAYHFAKSEPDKFKQLTVEKGINNTPLLIGCCARFQCKKYAKYEGGDHWIFLGQVVQLDYDQEQKPLLFHQGKLRFLDN